MPPSTHGWHACRSRLHALLHRTRNRNAPRPPLSSPPARTRPLRVAILRAHGASRDRRLGIPGEGTLRGVLAARDLVAWYNGLPGTRDFAARLGLEESRSEQAVVIGQGNVALDVARLLLTPVDNLR